MPAYTKTSLAEALTRLGSKKANWIWEKEQGGANPVLADKYRNYNANKNKHGWSELFDYCWCVYEKAFTATGDQLIGRVADLKGFKAKVAGIIVERGDTLFNSSTQGNILEMDKWSPVVNDCWILGGVHRRADFRLESPRAMANLWDGDRKGLVVTAREILGLTRFGYERVVQQNLVKYVSKSPLRSLTATLEAYAECIAAQEKAGPIAAIRLMGLRDDVAAQIRGFDRSGLKKVN
jgi:hypothetical protein